MNTKQPVNRLSVITYLPFYLPVVFVFTIYFLTRTPAVGLIDSGELAAGCYLLNILHPTGYPLYTLIGRLFSLVPIGTIITRLTILSALFSACGLGIFILICRQLRYNPLTSAAIATLAGLSPPIWSVCTDVEVYSLTFLLSLLVWLVVINFQHDNRLALFPYLIGLTLTNHLTGLWTVIGACVTLLLIYRQRLFRIFPSLFFFFLLGLTPYLFLIIRARAGPLLAWGNPVNLERFWWHVTGRQYQVWMFSSSFNQVLANTGKGIILLLRSFGFVLLPVIIYGFLILYKRQRQFALGLTVTTIMSIIYAANYSIPDIDAYYGPAVIPLAVFAGAGIDALFQRFRRITYLVWVLPFVIIIFNFPLQNKRQHYIAYDQAVNTLQSADSNGIIITEWWDIYAPVFYLQEIEKIRPDVCIIDKELLRRSWYFKYLEKEYPWLVENSRMEVQRFLNHLDRFEHNQPYDPIVIQESYIALLRSFIINNPERPAYTTFPLEADNDSRQLLTGFNLVPTGVLFQVRTDSFVPAFDYNRLEVRIPRLGMDERSLFNLNRYRMFVRARIALLKRLNRDSEALAVENWYHQVFSNRL